MNKPQGKNRFHFLQSLNRLAVRTQNKFPPVCSVVAPSRAIFPGAPDSTAVGSGTSQGPHPSHLTPTAPQHPLPETTSHPRSLCPGPSTELWKTSLVSFICSLGWEVLMASQTSLKMFLLVPNPASQNTLIRTNKVPSPES